MENEKYSKEFEKLMKGQDYESALYLAENRLPHEVNAVADIAYNYYMKNKCCEISLRIAEDHFDDRINEAANATYKQWIEMEMYSSALYVAEEYFPEKANYTAFLEIKNGLEEYKSVVMGVNPSSSDKFDKFTLKSLPNVRKVLTDVADEYLDEDNMLHYFSKNAYRIYKIDIRSEFSKIEKLAQEKWINPKKFNLEEKLKNAVSCEDYILAAKVRDKLLKL